MDIEGNSYWAKTIGHQIWMTENLKVKKYRNGDTIPQVQDPLQWSQLTTGAWCYYQNDSTNGIWYNWFAVNDPRGLAPSGYHVPTNAEWTVLTNFLGGEGVAGEKMRSTSGWIYGNSTNTSGFTGLPGGFRMYDGAFYINGTDACWWSSSEFDFNGAFARSLECCSNDVYEIAFDMACGLSVRCLKD
jgi:uncharacterized protein (TIGR02145 family)